MVQDCLCHLAVIFLCADTALNRILQEFDRQGMMTSEYVYIMPVMNMVTYEVSPQLRRYYEHIRLVCDDAIILCNDALILCNDYVGTWSEWLLK